MHTKKAVSTNVDICWPYSSLPPLQRWSGTQQFCSNTASHPNTYFEYRRYEIHIIFIAQSANCFWALYFCTIQENQHDVQERRLMQAVQWEKKWARCGNLRPRWWPRTLLSTTTSSMCPACNSIVVCTCCTQSVMAEEATLKLTDLLKQ